jgi:hypothetical protein
MKQKSVAPLTRTHYTDFEPANLCSYSLKLCASEIEE